MKFDEILDRYIRDRNLKKNTILSIRHSLQGFSLNKKKNAVRVVEILASDYSKSTKRVMLKAIKGVFRYINEVLHISIENPVAGIRIQDGPPRSRTPTDQELSEILDYTDRTASIMDCLYLRLLILTGARCSSIETLRPCDMDSRNRLSIYNQKLDRRYSVAIPIKDQYTLDLWERVTADIGNDDLIFEQRTCHERLSRRMQKLFKPDANGENLTPHSIRHGFATRLSNSGVPIKTACAILDTSASVMLNTYISVKQTDIDRLFEGVASAGERAKENNQKEQKEEKEEKTAPPVKRRLKPL